MSVEENMGFGLRINGVAKADVKNLVDLDATVLKLDKYIRT